MFDEYPALLSVTETSILLSCERHAIYTLIANGELEAIKANKKDWRVTKDSLIFYSLKSSGLDITKEEIYDYI